MRYFAKVKQLPLVSVCAMLVAISFPAGAQDQSGQGQSIPRGVRIIAAPTSETSDPSQLNPPGLEAVRPAPQAPGQPPSRLDAPGPTSPATSGLLVPPASQPGLGANNPSPALLTPAPALNPVEASTPATPASPNPTAATGNKTGAPSTSAPHAPLLQPAPSATPYGAAPSAPTPGTSDFANAPNQSDGGVYSSRPGSGGLRKDLNIPNTAGLRMQILPGQELPVGSRVSFEVSSKQPGYLILVDIDTTGKLVQIYPNPMSLLVPAGAREMSNYLRPGKPFSIPDKDSAYSGFEFVTSPPAGTALVLAILSDRPVQMIDLPDIPGNLLGGPPALDYLTKLASELRIPTTKGQLEEAHWSFDAAFYAIR